MSDYTPTTEMVKVRYAIGHGGLSDDEEDVRADAFDRWLAAEKAKWQADERERIAETVEVHMRRYDRTGFSAVGDAYANAARIARQGGSDG